MAELCSAVEEFDSLWFWHRLFDTVQYRQAKNRVRQILDDIQKSGMTPDQQLAYVQEIVRASLVLYTR